MLMKLNVKNKFLGCAFGDVTLEPLKADGQLLNSYPSTDNELKLCILWLLRQRVVWWGVLSDVNAHLFVGPIERLSPWTAVTLQTDSVVSRFMTYSVKFQTCCGFGNVSLPGWKLSSAYGMTLSVEPGNTFLAPPSQFLKPAGYLTPGILGRSRLFGADPVYNDVYDVVLTCDGPLIDDDDIEAEGSPVSTFADVPLPLIATLCGGSWGLGYSFTNLLS
jgi:hypothetical protein